MDLNIISIKTDPDPFFRVTGTYKSDEIRIRIGQKTGGKIRIIRKVRLLLNAACTWFCQEIWIWHWIRVCLSGAVWAFESGSLLSVLKYQRILFSIGSIKFQIFGLFLQISFIYIKNKPLRIHILRTKSGSGYV